MQALAEEASTRRQSPAAREAEVLLLLRGLIALVEVDPRSQVWRCQQQLAGTHCTSSLASLCNGQCAGRRMHMFWTMRADGFA